LRAQLRAAGKLDGVCFATHGSMASAADGDLDGRMLALIHEECPGVPITVGLDLHAMVTERMIEHSIAAVSYRTHPHLDLWETGEKAAKILLGALAGQTSPVQSMVRAPMLFADCGTNVGELARIFADIEAWEAADPHVLSLSLNMAFPSLDAAGQGWVAVAVVDGDQALADALAARLAARCWDARAVLWWVVTSSLPSLSLSDCTDQPISADRCAHSHCLNLWQE
jgi:microcystin degradation protein MlrC